MSDLKPCPFCGNAASLFEDSNHSTAYLVECLADGCPASPNIWELDKATAIAAWNTRAPDWQSIATEAMRLLSQKTRDGSVIAWLKDVEALDDRFRAAGGVLEKPA